jgi:DNA-binding transcriptional LysR family regulator
MPEAINLNRLAYFAAVVDAGSFTAAAERLGITKAVVSQQVARLEEEVGTTLLARTTRKVQPTEAGRIFHARCANILREAEDAFGELSQAATKPTGTLRITAPFDYGISRVVPAVTQFAEAYPACKVELSLSDRKMDLTADNIDTAIRVGWLADTSHQARRIGSFEQLLVAPPRFADVIARIDSPKRLLALPFIANAALRNPLDWSFSRGQRERQDVQWRATISLDATMAVHAAVLAGAGISALPDFLVAGDLAAGRLIHVLPAWKLPSGGIHAVFPAARFRPSKVTAFVSVLMACERRATEH